MKVSRASLSGSLMLTVGLIVLVTTISVSLAGYLFGKASIEGQIRSKIAAVASESAASVDTYMLARVEEIRQMTTSQLEVATITPVERVKVIQDYAGAFGNQRYQDISILDLQGNVVGSNGAPQIDKGSDLIKTLNAATRPGVLDAMKFGDQTSELFVVYAPLLDENGKRSGTLIGRLLTTELVGIVRAIPVDASTSIFLTHHGVMMGEQRGKSSPAFEAMAHSLHSDGVMSSEIATLGLGISVAADPAAALAPVRDLAVRAAIVGILVTLLAFLATLWAARRIATPLGDVASAAHALAGGSLDVTVDTSRLGLRELSDLGTSFNTMAGALRGLIGGIGSASVAISRTARENLETAQSLKSGTEEQAHAAAQITSALAELTANARAIERDCADLESSSRKGLTQLDALVSEVSSTNVALHQLTATIDRSNDAGRVLAKQSIAVAERARDVGQRAEAAQQSADRGGEAVRTMIGDINLVGERLVETVARLEHLSDATAAAITAQIEVINDVAERSKLLALNAGIEAARAGESGRGFSVIASELHRLAGGSKDAGDEVKALVKSVVSETRELVENAKSASSIAQGAITRASETGEAIDLLVAQISENTRGAREIGAIAEDQAERTSEIEIATDEMRRMAQMTASSAQAVDQISKQVRVAVQLATNVAEQVTRATREQVTSLGIIEQSAGEIDRTNRSVAAAAQASFAASASLQREIAALAQEVDGFTGGGPEREHSLDSRELHATALSAGYSPA